jgi:sporulation-control protein spo0M
MSKSKNGQIKNVQTENIEQNVEQQNAEQQQVEKVVENVVEAEVNMDPKFLMQELKKVPLIGIIKNTYDALKLLAKLDAPQRVFVMKYEKEIDRLKNNSSSILCKRTAKAKELNLPLEEYIEKHCNTRTGGGGVKSTYGYEIEGVEIEFNEYELKAVPFLKELKLFPSTFADINDQLYWLSLDNESFRYRKNEASTKCIANKKLKKQNVVVEVVETPVVEPTDNI